MEKRRYLQEKVYAEEIKRMDVWKTPRRLYDVQALSNHNVLMFSIYFDNLDLFIHEKHLPSTVWSEE